MGATGGVYLHSFYYIQVVFHSRDFLFTISRYPDNFCIPAFQGNRSGIPGNRIYKVNLSIILTLPVFSIECYEFLKNAQL
jgi:hypothetical protein